MPEREAALRQELVRAARYLSDRDLTWGSSGNLSARIDDGHILLSGTGTWMRYMESHEFAVVRLGDGSAVDAIRPSKEFPMHAAIYRNASEARFAIHSAPPYTTWFACTHRRPESGLFIESMHYLDRIAEVDYALPGSAALGEGVAAVAADYPVMILRNHGVIVYDATVRDALMRIESLELACRLAFLSESSGSPLHLLPPEKIRAFHESRAYKPQEDKAYGAQEGG